MAVSTPALTAEALALAADAKRALVRTPIDGELSDGSDISSVASMGRQITELSEAQCADLMEQQCRGFQSRESDFWKRQNTTPATRRNEECLEGLRRQISCPTPSNLRTQPGTRLARIQDSRSGSSNNTPCGTPFSSRQVSQAAEAPDEGLIESAICAVVSECNFSVAVADPTTMDAELVAVSEGFVRLTGYDREEVVGENCRFLNEGCSMPEEQRQCLCRAVETGSPFVGVLDNRKKSGDPFSNLLDLRGLVIAKNARSGEDIWVLVAIQQDVTDMDRTRLPANHLPLHNQVASRIRKRLVKQLAELGLSAAMTELKWQEKLSPRTPSSCSIRKPVGVWCLAPTICWKQASDVASQTGQGQLLAVPGRAASGTAALGCGPVGSSGAAPGCTAARPEEAPPGGKVEAAEQGTAAGPLPALGAAAALGAALLAVRLVQGGRRT
eukprot:CAMPEP_0179057180 /NCGR_PEP_ID=MMETSP0796-20121207/24199_1 /TAXON_ID=73915 /ORGANISM="Pyrodinium bahamense, Strain pbaha01" /LENGTH=441 /DNA_ID=CAMNT_0020753887 /DNA_START=99 /DNA_END=1424 /DNA_ORIENTATION=+